GTGPGAPDRQSLVRERVVVSPARRVEAVPGQRFGPLDRGQGWLVPLPGGADDRIGAVLLARRRPHGPAAALLLPFAASDRRVQLDELLDPLFAGHLVQVAVDLLAR